VTILVNRKRKQIGYFSDEVAAAKVYDQVKINPAVNYEAKYILAVAAKLTLRTTPGERRNWWGKAEILVSLDK